MTAPVAVLTAAAHRGGKRVADHLVDDGWDLALWSKAALRARVEHARARGRRALAVRGDLADPRSVALMVATTSAELETVDAVIHLDADELAIDATGSDAATAELVGLGAVKVVYVATTTWSAAAPLAWCADREIDAIALDAAMKVHDLAPTIASFLGS